MNKILICNNCKSYWIYPKNTCDKCGSNTLTETDSNNLFLTEDFINCEKLITKRYIHATERSTFTYKEVLELMNIVKLEFSLQILKNYNITLVEKK
jgi:hypothetical protein